MPPKEPQLTQEHINEFSLNSLGYYVKVREIWNNTRKKKDFKFDVISYENDKEIIIQQGKKVFSCNEIEAIKERDKIIEFYLNKVKK